MLADRLAKLKRGCVELVTAAELERKLALGRPLRVKLGVDPTSPDLHLGHTVVLNRLRAFQDQGHAAILIIGDFTARVGDPSGRDGTRPTLSAAEVRANAKTYQEQAFKVLDRSRAEVRFNSEWLEPFLREGGLFEAMKRATVGQLLQREDFQARMKAQGPISLLEILYPLLQGYDSVAVKADVELGGNDQLFNLLMGRQMQKDAGQEPQVALTTPLLVGLDGTKKMSKSYGNAIGLTDSPRDMFGKLMRISDELMLAYYELLTDEDLAAVKASHPMEAKKRLAYSLASRFHGEERAREERDYFEKTFSRKETPADAHEVAFSGAASSSWSSWLAAIEAVPSRKEAQRLLAQGAVSADGEKLKDESMADFFKRKSDAKEFSLRIGKHKFYRVVVKP